MVDQCVNLICTNPRHSICIRRIQQLLTAQVPRVIYICFFLYIQIGYQAYKLRERIIISQEKFALFNIKFSDLEL